MGMIFLLVLCLVRGGYLVYGIFYIVGDNFDIRLNDDVKMGIRDYLKRFNI